MTTIRPYRYEDYPVLKDMLLNEQCEHNYIAGVNCETFVMEKDNTVAGFYTFTLSRGFPYLVHFLVDKTRTTYKDTLRLSKSVKTWVREHGFRKAITNVPIIDGKEKEDNLRFVRFYKGKKYAQDNLLAYYMIYDRR